MSDISNKVYDLLVSQNIKKEDMIDTLENIKSEIDIKLWEKISISPLIFFKLKDTIFYNFEYCHYNNSRTGKTTLRDYGRDYPTFMFNFNSSTYIPYDEVVELLDEINDIKEKWNPNICVANIYAKTDFSWNVGEDNHLSLIIYDAKNETPMKYGYYNNSYSGIVDGFGNNIKHADNVVLCSIQQMDMYREYNILTQVLYDLANTLNIAFQNKKGVFVELNDYKYDYES